MKRYAIYDLKSGHILQTYSHVDRSGRHKSLSDEDVLETLHPSIARDSVGVAVIDIQPTAGTPSGFRIDPQTRKLSVPSTPKP
jgi:hypothetical protein